MRMLSALPALLAAGVALAVPVAAQSPSHPLDGLSAKDHWAVYDALLASGKTDSTTRYLYVALHEAPKAEVLAWKPGQPFRREGFVHLFQNGKGYEAVVDIANKKLVSWREIPGRQYMALEGEQETVNELLLKDSRVREAIRRRGVTDFTHVNCFPQNEGYFDLPEERNHRVMRAICGSERGRFSGYGETYEGLVVVVDLTDKKILRIIDTGVRPSGGPAGEYDAEAIGPTREIKTPIAVSQPLGPSFTLTGQQVSWQNWKFHFRVDARRGIVLSLVRYGEGGRDRSVLYQGSLSELFVPYMDPEEPWGYQSYFDLGSYPSVMGGVASTLEPGLDCPIHATYFDAVVASDKGLPRQRVRAACLFERLTGDPAWRHARDGNRVVESRAQRQLVLRMFMTAGNYDYLFDWVFEQNGSLKLNAGATGMDQVRGAKSRDATGETDDDKYGRFIAPYLVGVNHSHFFSFRLDLDVDGTANTLMIDRLTTERQPETSVRRSLWKVVSNAAGTEREAMRHSTMSEPELWRIVNPSVPGPYGDPVGYEIAGGHGALTLLSPDDYMQKRAGFTNHTLWVTPLNQDELFAAGDYPSVSTAGDGLPKWTAANRAIANTDLVAWLTVGFHHVPRPEDWPVMPSVWHGIELRPVGFFARNPAIDLPKTP
jgi:primary-amine oxidase